MSKHSFRFRCLVCLLPLAVALLLPCAWADKVVMKNGNTFEGEILEESEKQVVLKMEYGNMTFKRKDIESVTKGKYTPPPPADAPASSAPAKEESTDKVDNADGLRRTVQINEAMRKRDFGKALDLLEQEKEEAQGAPEKLALIEGKIKKIKEQAYVQIEIKLTQISTGPEPDPAVRRDKNAEPVDDKEIREELDASLFAIFKRALGQRGYIVADRAQAKGKRVQKLTVTYSESSGAAYFTSSGDVAGYRIEAKCHMELTSANGGTLWSDNVEAITPSSLSGGSTREGALGDLAGKVAALRFGVSE